MGDTRTTPSRTLSAPSHVPFDLGVPAEPSAPARGAGDPVADDLPDIPGLGAAEAEPSDEAPASWWRRRRGLILQWGMVLAAVASLPLVWDRLPHPAMLWSTASRAEPIWLVVVVAAEAASMASFARLQRRLLRIGGLRMSLRRAFAITYAGNALSTTLPAGPAVSVVYTYQQFRRGGASGRLATAVILAGGVITTAAYTVIGMLAVMADARARGPALAAMGFLLVLAALLVPVLRVPRARAVLAAPPRRLWRAAMDHRRIAPYAERLREGRDVLRPTRRDWGVLAVLATLNWVFDIMALLAASRAVGIEVDPSGVTLAYFAAQAAGSALPLLPGGIGAIESSMAASLVAFGATLTPAAAAVGLYRLVSYWAVVLVGWIAWFALHEGPRVSARTRRRLSATGHAVLNGFTSAACLTPYGSAHTLPAEARRS